MNGCSQGQDNFQMKLVTHFFVLQCQLQYQTSLCIRNLDLRLMLSLSEGEGESGTDEGPGFSTNIVYSNCGIILMRKPYLENMTY